MEALHDKFAQVLEQLKEYKQWKLKQKYGFFGEFRNAIALKVGDKVVHFPEELKEILEIINNAKNESSLPKLEKHLTELTKSIKSANDKIIPVPLKIKLEQTLVAPNAKLVDIASSKVATATSYKEFMQNMSEEQEKGARYSPL